MAGSPNPRPVALLLLRRLLTNRKGSTGPRPLPALDGAVDKLPVPSSAVAENMKAKQILAVHDAAADLARRTLKDALRVADERGLDPRAVVQAASQVLAASAWATWGDDSGEAD